MKDKKYSTNKNTENLYKMAMMGKLPHALLFETEDIDKDGLNVAQNTAKILLCRSDSAKPCGNCIACRKIDMGVHPDVQTISVNPPYKTIRMDDVRQLRSDTYLSPNESPYKIYIITDGSLMNEQSQNVLLKTLEEPPCKVKIIILCKSRFSMIPTIRSRVQVFELAKKSKASSSSRINDIVRSLFKGCACQKDLEIIKETSKLVKDKELFKKVTERIEDDLSKACTAKVRGEVLDELEFFDCLSMKRLIYMRDKTIEINKLIKKNINNQLLVSGLCIMLSGK